MVSPAEFVLANRIPVDVRPLIETRYGVGVVSVIESGIWKVMLWLRFGSCTIDRAGVNAEGPEPAAGASPKETSVGEMASRGSPVATMVST